MPHVDWVSFTVPIDVRPRYTAQGMFRVALNALRAYSPLAYELLPEAETEVQNGRAPYSESWHMDNGIVVFTNRLLPHALFEISARGVAQFAERDLLTFCDELRPRMTRIDYAVDLDTPIAPDEFAQARDVARFKSTSEFKSSSGHTFYVGSRESDRYCRVYRYYEPHPRHETLRVEFVLKAEQARAFVDTLTTFLPRDVAGVLGNTFGFNHPAWEIRDDLAPLKAWRGSRETPRTLYWLNAQVAPAIKKLHDAGEFDARAWIDDILNGGSMTD